MSNFSLLDEAIRSAMGVINPNAKFRLSDILVEEVSFVDYPANNHKFLVVKRNNTLKATVPSKDMDRDKLKELRKSRSSEYGIEVLDSGSNLTFPSGYPTSLSKYGDPVNLKFPTDTVERARNARVRFKQFADTYKKSSSKRVVHERIVRAELKHGIKPKYDPDDPLDKLLPASLRDKMEKQAQQNCEGKMLKETKLAVAKSITDALTRLTAFAKVLKDTPDETEDVKLPSELSKELSGIAALLAKTFVEHGVAKTTDDLIQTVEALVQISELSMTLAEETAVAGEVSDETTARMQQMSSLLGALMKSEETPAEETPAEETLAEDAPLKVEEEEKSEEASEVALEEETPPPPKLEEEEKSEESSEESKEDNKSDRILQALEGLTNVMTTFIEAQTKAESPPPVEEKEDDIQKQLDAMKEQNRQLAKKLEKAVESPPKRAAGTGNVDPTPKRRIFPQVYNHRIYDPDVESAS